MGWLWQRRRGTREGTPVRAVGRARPLYGLQSRLGDNDVVPLAGHRRYVDLLRPNLDDSPLMTPGQVARSTPDTEPGYCACHVDTGWGLRHEF